MIRIRFLCNKLHLLSLILFAFPSLALADYREVHARLLCTENSAIIQFVNSWNGALPDYPDLPETFAEKFESATDFPELECDLGGQLRQRMLRLKIGNDLQVAWGACGAGLRAFFSLWIGEHKVFSEKYFHNLCHWGQFDDVDAIVYEGRDLLLCTYPNTNANWPHTENPNPEQLACINAYEIYVNAINAPIDEIEYPLDGTERREGHVELRSSTEDELCNRLVFGLNEYEHQYKIFTDFPDEFHRANTLRSDKIPEDRYRRYSPYVVDINNDGYTDMVAVRSRGLHGEDHYISMLIDGGLTPVTKESAIPPPISAIPLFLGEWGDRLDNSYELIIFEWGNEIYVYMMGLFPHNTRDWIVMQMRPDGTADTICELDRIEINF